MDTRIRKSFCSAQALRKAAPATHEYARIATKTKQVTPMTNNLMFDRRVLRGIPFKLGATQQVAPLTSTALSTMRDRLLKAQAASANPMPQGSRETPEPVEGRVHAETYTEKIYIELTAKPNEHTAHTQTDLAIHRPPTPLFMPAKEEVDESTQIEDGDLFDFDEEVVPILEVLVGKVLEQSLREVLEEAELEELRQREENFERQRIQQLLEVQRIEEIERRKQAEAARRVVEAAAAERVRVQIQKKRFAFDFSKKMRANRHSFVLQELKEGGHFQDPKLVAVEMQFLPAIMTNVVHQVDHQKAVNKDAILGCMQAVAKAFEITSDVTKTIKEREAAHFAMKMQQVTAKADRERIRELEKTELRNMRAADTREETRALERTLRDMEEHECQLMDVDDTNVLLIEDANEYPESEKEDSEEAKKEEGADELSNA